MGIGYGMAIGRSTAATVPSVLGRTTAQAGSTPSAVGLRVGAITYVVDNTCNNIGRIMSQTPAAGTTAQLGSAVAAERAMRTESTWVCGVSRERTCSLPVVPRSGRVHGRRSRGRRRRGR
jgi:hypothetical protein